ncbi:MAG: DUF1905 domain-containing protein [Bacteroidales bacterium]|nr:DUF1905 domain-containing protein [Bacteroidales bacterium]MBN2818640.1 DUF1905 domain-containing protein [Bacteroidales bacterium]
MFHFTGEIYKKGYNYLVDVPSTATEYFNRHGNIPVHGRINGTEFIGTISPRKNKLFVLHLNAEIRKKTGLSVEDKADVFIEYDNVSREKETPLDLEQILREKDDNWEIYQNFTSARKRELINYIEDAKKAETRLKRIEKIVEYVIRKRKQY